MALLMQIFPQGGWAQQPADDELNVLREQIEELKRHNSVQDRVIRQLILRLRQMDGTSEAPASASAPAEGTQAPSAAEPRRADPTVAVEGSKDSAEPTTASQSPAPPAAATTAPTTQGEAQAGNRPSVTAGMEALVQEEHGFFKGKLSGEVGLTYSRSDRAHMTLNGFLALDAIFLGQINIDQVKSDIVTADFAVRAGLGDRLQLDLNAPMVYRKTTYQSGGAEGGGPKVSETTVSEDWQLGDASFGLSWQVLKESQMTPDTVWSLRVKAPTGSSPYGIKLVQPDPNNSNLIVPESLPSGSGVWSLSSGFSVLRTVDPAVLFANLSYVHNFEEKVDDISTTLGETVPGRVRLGNSVQFGVGTAFALSERTSLHFSYSQRLTRRSKMRAEDGPWNSITGSSANAISLNMGLTQRLTQGLSMVANLGIGLTPDAPDVQFGLKFPF